MTSHETFGHALNLFALNPVLHFHQVLFSLIVFLRPSVVVPFSQSLHRACLLSVSFSLPSNHLATTTNTTITLQASVLDGAGVDDWTDDQLFIQDTYGSPNLQVTACWSKAGVFGIALEWPQNDCEVAFVHFFRPRPA